MLEETFLIAAFTLAGAISGVVILKIISKWKTSSKKKERFIKPFSTTKEELQSLQFEKSLISQSITRVYEASYEGKLDLIERDRLLLKYKQQLDSYDKKIADLQSIVDISELADMRNGLVSLLEKRITAIDHKLAEISNKYGISTSDIIIGSSKSGQESIIDGSSTRKEKNKEKEEGQNKNADKKYQSYESNEEEMVAMTTIGGQKDQKEYSAKEKVKAEEKNIDELQKEIMHALGRLEQMDPDNTYEDHKRSINNNNINNNNINNNNNNNKKRDALSSFNSI